MCDYLAEEAKMKARVAESLNSIERRREASEEGQNHHQEGENQQQQQVFKPTPPTSGNPTSPPRNFESMQQEQVTAPRGFEINFLGAAIPAPTPLSNSAVQRIDHCHFSSFVSRDRSIAAYNVFNFDANSPVIQHQECPSIDANPEDNTIPHGASASASSSSSGSPTIPSGALFDRGHLVHPAFLSYGKDAQEAAEGLHDARFPTNVVPLHSNISRPPNRAWKAIEMHVYNDIAGNEAKDRKISGVAGCVFLDSDVIGAIPADAKTTSENNNNHNNKIQTVQVPNFYFFIVFYISKNDGNLKKESYLVKNYEKIDDVTIAPPKANIKYQDCACAITTIEQLADIRFNDPRIRLLDGMTRHPLDVGTTVSFPAVDIRDRGGRARHYESKRETSFSALDDQTWVQYYSKSPLVTLSHSHFSTVYDVVQQRPIFSCFNYDPATDCWQKSRQISAHCRDLKEWSECQQDADPKIPSWSAPKKMPHHSIRFVVPRFVTCGDVDDMSMTLDLMSGVKARDEAILTSNAMFEDDKNVKNLHDAIDEIVVRMRMKARRLDKTLTGFFGTAPSRDGRTVAWFVFFFDLPETGFTIDGNNNQTNEDENENSLSVRSDTKNASVARQMLAYTSSGSGSSSPNAREGVPTSNEYEAYIIRRERNLWAQVPLDDLGTIGLETGVWFNDDMRRNFSPIKEELDDE